MRRCHGALWNPPINALRVPLSLQLTRAAGECSTALLTLPSVRSQAERRGAVAAAVAVGARPPSRTCICRCTSRVRTCTQVWLPVEWLPELVAEFDTSLPVHVDKPAAKRSRADAYDA
jgi:hypothetical protein